MRGDGSGGSPGKEECLEALHNLAAGSEGASNSALAARLGVSRGAVSQMLRALAGEGLVDYSPYGRAGLTEQGRRAAARIVRRHRLWERLLTDVLGMPWEHVHGEACALEHATSEALERRLDEFLGFPDACPHGQPMPRVGQSERPRVGRALSEVAPPARVTVSGVTDEAPDLLEYLRSVGLLPGKEVTIEASETHDETVTIRLGDRALALALPVAGKILVSVGPARARKRRDTKHLEPQRPVEAGRD